MNKGREKGKRKGQRKLGLPFRPTPSPLSFSPTRASFPTKPTPPLSLLSPRGPAQAKATEPSTLSPSPFLTDERDPPVRYLSFLSSSPSRGPRRRPPVLPSVPDKARGEDKPIVAAGTSSPSYRVSRQRFPLSGM